MAFGRRTKYELLYKIKTYSYNRNHVCMITVYALNIAKRRKKKMRITCGTDVIEIERIKESIEKSGEAFLKKIYTQTEINYCQAKRKAMYQHFAARFAAKEAIFKAISCYLKEKFDITWTDVEIINEQDGKPKVHFLQKEIPNINIDLSISHCQNYAVATAIAIKE